MEAGTMYDVTRYPAAAWERLGQYVRTRRVALKMSQDDLADVSGRGVNTVSGIEAGSGPRRELTLVHICEALGWTADSYLRILDGEEPVLAEVEPEPVLDTALRYERPPGVDDATWAELEALFEHDYAVWDRMRRRRD